MCKNNTKKPTHVGQKNTHYEILCACVRVCTAYGVRFYISLFVEMICFFRYFEKSNKQNIRQQTKDHIFFVARNTKEKKIFFVHWCISSPFVCVRW